MKTHIMLAIAAAALGACGQSREPENDANVPSANQQSQAADTYSATGTVTAVSGDQVTIDHGPIEEIGWPAMTMDFTATGDVAQGVEAGSEVSFEFRQDGGTYVLTSLEQR